MSILCEWERPDCKNGTRDQYHNTQCHILTDCNFPNRDECPFFVKNKDYVPDAYDVYVKSLEEKDETLRRHNTD